MRWLICLIFLGCTTWPSRKTWDAVCYSGGNIFWRGTISKIEREGNCIYFRDSNRVETIVCSTSCYLSEATNGQSK